MTKGILLALVLVLAPTVAVADDGSPPPAWLRSRVAEPSTQRSSVGARLFAFDSLVASLIVEPRAIASLPPTPAPRPQRRVSVQLVSSPAVGDHEIGTLSILIGQAPASCSPSPAGCPGTPSRP